MDLKDILNLISIKKEKGKFKTEYGNKTIEGLEAMFINNLTIYKYTIEDVMSGEKKEGFSTSLVKMEKMEKYYTGKYTGYYFNYEKINIDNTEFSDY